MSRCESCPLAEGECLYGGRGRCELIAADLRRRAAWPGAPAPHLDILTGKTPRNPPSFETVRLDLGEQAEKPLPPLAARVMNYAISTAKHVAAGMPETSGAEKARRLEICRGSDAVPRCDNYRPSDGACSKCGCPLQEKAARALEFCPIGKWGPAADTPDTP